MTDHRHFLLSNHGAHSYFGNIECSVCQKQFKTVNKMKGHLCNICTVCGKLFTRKQNLQKHDCQKQKTYKCDKCNKQYATKTNLERHTCKYCSVCRIIFSSTQKKYKHKCINSAEETRLKPSSSEGKPTTTTFNHAEGQSDQSSSSAKEPNDKLPTYSRAPILTSISIEEQTVKPSNAPEKTSVKSSSSKGEPSCKPLNSKSASDISTIHVARDVQYFEPVRSHWQRQKCREFSILGTVTMSSESTRKVLNRPTEVKNIEGDGNCFFRCISYIVTGNQEHFAFFRSRVIQNLKNNPQLGRTLFERNMTVPEYLNETKMHINATWASQVEILSMAHLLRTNIYVYTQIQGSNNFQWLKHSANFVYKNITPSVHSIYLNHRNRNHYEIVLDVQLPAIEIPRNFDTDNDLYRELKAQMEKSVTNKSKQKLDQFEGMTNQEKTRFRVRKWRNKGNNRDKENKRKRESSQNRTNESEHKTQKRQSQEFRDKENKRKRENPDIRSNERKRITQQRQSQEFRDEKNKLKKESSQNRTYEREHKIQKRLSQEFRDKENKGKKESSRNRTNEREHKTQKRLSQQVRDEENKRKKESSRNRTNEREHKTQKRLSHEFRDEENQRKRNDIGNRYREKEKKQIKRSHSSVRQKENERKKSKKDIPDMKILIQTFHEAVQNGPAYICTCCDQTWYREGVRAASSLHITDASLKEKVFTSKESAEKTEWICYTCVSNVKKNKLPPLAKANQVQFPNKPECLDITHLEERLIAPRIPFMQLRELPRGGQISINGNVVNVPTNISSTVSKLPRTQSDNMCIPLQLKRKLSYSHHVNMEMVRPNKVKEALRHLIQNSELYKEEGITMDESWDINESQNDEALQISEPHQNDQNNNIEDKSGQHSTNNLHVNGTERDNWDETTVEDQAVGTMDTLLQPIDPAADSSRIAAFAPAEGNTPINIFLDRFSEELAFPTIFCGKKRTENKDREVPVHYSEICKSELRRSDRRVAANIPNLFFKVKKLQAKHILDKSNLCLRKTKNTKNITAGYMKNKDNIMKLCHLDEGYRAFKDLRGSPPYWEKTKKDLFAMLRCLGIPTWFGSFSSAETRWVHLLKIFSHTLTGKELTEDEINNLNWFEKCKLIRQDPVTCARHFKHQVDKLISQILTTSNSPIGKVIDYFYKVEFQMRGSPHIHMLMWVEGATHLDDNYENEADIIEFVNCHISVQRDTEIPNLIKMQEHAHSRTCRKKGKNICRFGYPIPPVPETCILLPLEGPESKSEKHQSNFKKISKTLNTVKTNEHMEFDMFLEKLGLDFDEYILALRSSITSQKLFYKRNVSENRINCYNKTILQCWRANMDLQYVLDPYACAMYIVTYIAKSQRGMSNLLYAATKEAREGNMDLRKQVRSIGHKFLTHVELSAQESVFYILQMPLKKSSKDVIFINTSPEEERLGLLKSLKQIEQLPDDSLDIQATTIHERYANRPKMLKNVCLADFVSKYRNCYSSSKPHSAESDVSDHEDDESEQQIITFKVGNATFKKRDRQVCIRYIRYQEAIDQENYFREILLLFSPWTTESHLIGKADSYTEQYQFLSKGNDSIKSKMAEYHHIFPKLDKAIDDAENTNEEALEEKWNENAPSTRKEEDSSEPCKDSELYAVLDPPALPENDSDGQELTSVGIVNKYISDEDYYTLIRSLNIQQQHFFMYVLHHFKSSDLPLHQFLSGGAGVGKSVLVNAIYQAISRFFNSTPGANPDEPKVLLAAPTGKAAHLIKGNTLHSLLKIPANQGFEYKPLVQEKLNTLQCTFRHVKLIIIDEISMVGNKMFAFIHQRLQQIMGSNKLFGGLSILAVGDMFQLKPVFDGWIFDNLSLDYGPLAANIWKDNFTMYELKEIMRQKDNKEFAELLNRLREANHSKEDIQFLLQRKIPTDLLHPEYPLAVPHIYTRNADVESHNKIVCDIQGSKAITIPAHDVVLGDVGIEVKQRIINSIPKETTKTMGLAKDLTTAIGLRNELSCNVNVEDGLSNGAAFILDSFGPLDKKGRFRYLWALFEYADVGKQCRLENKNLYNTTGNKDLTPIFTVKRQFPVGRYKAACVVREQFPIRCAAAKTTHRSQGDTMKSAVVDFTGRTFPHSHYVAISRVTDIKHLYIRNLNESKIKVDDRVKDEQKRLRQNGTTDSLLSQLQQKKAEFTILFQNTRSLHKHIDDIRSSIIYKNMDCLIFAESKIKTSDPDDMYSISGYQLHRFDWPHNENQRPSYGLIVYTKEVMDPSLFSYNSIHSNNDVIEMVQFNIHQTTVFAIYVSPRTKKQTLNTFLSKLCQDQRKPQIYIGDFNLDLKNASNAKNNHIQSALKCNQLITSETTDQHSLLDHIYVTSETPVARCQVLESHFSDHKPIVLLVEQK